MNRPILAILFAWLGSTFTHAEKPPNVFAALGPYGDKMNPNTH